MAYSLFYRDKKTISRLFSHVYWVLIFRNGTRYSIFLLTTVPTFVFLTLDLFQTPGNIDKHQT